MESYSASLGKVAPQLFDTSYKDLQFTKNQNINILHYTTCSVAADLKIRRIFLLPVRQNGSGEHTPPSIRLTFCSIVTNSYFSTIQKTISS